MARLNDPNAVPIGIVDLDDQNRWEYMHEWELAVMHRRALKEESYETCKKIQDEVNRRIETATIDKALMNGFRYWNPKTEQYEGPLKFDGFNGLFDKYKY